MTKRNFYTTILCLFLVAFNVPSCGMKENEYLNSNDLNNDQERSLKIENSLENSQQMLYFQQGQYNNANIGTSPYGNNNEETEEKITNGQALSGPQKDNPSKGTSDDCDINRLINKDPLKNTLDDIKGIVTNSPIDINVVDCPESKIILRRLFGYSALKCKAICSYLKTYDCIIKKRDKKSGKTVEISGDEYIKKLEEIENRKFLDLSINGKATKMIDKLFVTYLKHDGHIKKDVDAKLSLHKKINEEFCREEINRESSYVKRRRVCYLNDLDFNSRRRFLYTQHELLLKNMLGDPNELETEHLGIMLHDIDFYHRYNVGKEIEYYYDQSMISKKNYLWISLYRCGSKTIGSLLWSIINSLCNFEKNVVNSIYTFLPFLCFGYKWQPECMAANGSFIDVNINLAGGFVNCFIFYIFLGKNESIFSLKNIKLLIYSSFNVNLNIKIANDFYMAINICGLLQALFFSFNEMKKDNIHVCEECENIILKHRNDEKLKSINEGGALYNKNIASNKFNEFENNDNNSEHNDNKSEHNDNKSEKGGNTNEFIIDTTVPNNNIINNINNDNDNKA